MGHRVKGSSHMFNNYDRVLQACLREFEAVVDALVEAEFDSAYAAMKRGEAIEIPVIGEAFPPPKHRGPLKAQVRQALLCRRWFELDAPAWAQPLPLKRSDCEWFLNQPNRRIRPIGPYGIMLRDHGWDYRTVEPFEQFAANYRGG
jgi:hypothetical protein